MTDGNSRLVANGSDSAPANAADEGQTETNAKQQSLLDRVQRLAAENQALKTRNTELKEGAERARLNGLMALCGALASTFTGVGLIVLMIVLLTENLTPKGGVLSSAEFIAGIAGGCSLILAVLVVAAYWAQSGRSAGSHL
jgi:hypothetical protein